MSTEATSPSEKKNESTRKLMEKRGAWGILVGSVLFAIFFLFIEEDDDEDVVVVVAVSFPTRQPDENMVIDYGAFFLHLSLSLSLSLSRLSTTRETGSLDFPFTIYLFIYFILFSLFMYLFIFLNGVVDLRHCATAQQDPAAFGGRILLYCPFALGTTSKSSPDKKMKRCI
eukprot:gene10293-7195_t